MGQGSKGAKDIYQEVVTHGNWFVHAYQWLDTEGLWKAIIGWLVGVLGILFIYSLKGFRWGKKLNQIVDHLDTSTKGGLQVIHEDLVAARQDLLKIQKDLDNKLHDCNPDSPTS